MGQNESNSTDEEKDYEKVGLDLIMRIINISTKLSGFDIKSLIDDVIDKKTEMIEMKDVRPLINFLRSAFSNDTKKIKDYMTAIYWYNKPYSIRLSLGRLKKLRMVRDLYAYKIEKCRDDRIQNRLDALLYCH